MSQLSYPRLLADVGGTNVRFALIREAGAGITDEQNFLCSDYPGIVEAATAYLNPLSITPVWASIGIATAIAGDAIKMTNNHWAFSQRELKAQLALAELTVINDFTALALSLPLLTSDELVKVGGGESNPDLPIALLGAGTGLGVSGLIPAHQPGEAPRWIPLQGEGGHVSFSPFNDKEDEILRILRRKFGHVSAERLLAGPGIVNLYLALAEINQLPFDPLEASAITERGVAGSCELCRETVDTFCGMLGTAAANLAVTLGARGGLYIGGGIVPKLGDYFGTSVFRKRFEQKGRFSNYLAAVPSFVIVASNPALRGTAAALDALAARPAA